MVLENIMATEEHLYQARYKSRFFQEGEAKGEAKGEARGETKGLIQHSKDSVLIVLHERGFTVPAESQELLDACDDLEQLNTWLRLATTTSSVEDVFRAESES